MWKRKAIAICHSTTYSFAANVCILRSYPFFSPKPEVSKLNVFSMLFHINILMFNIKKSKFDYKLFNANHKSDQHTDEHVIVSQYDVSKKL
jgi:hypothetical protein